MDRVARGGLLFTRGYTPNAKCAPSRACILTGRNSWQLEEAANHICYFPTKFKGFVEVLGSHGYFTGHTGKGWGPGVALDAEGKPREMTGKPYNHRKLTTPGKGIHPNDYAANFADFLADAPAGRPWLFWGGMLEPHRDYDYGSGVRQGKSPADIDRVPGYWPDNEVTRNDMLDYAREVEHFDSHLDRMLDLLEASGELDNTLVIVTSDHGMPFPRVKGNTYDASNRVPLAILWPMGIRNPGRTIGDYVSLIDLAPTIIQAAGLAWDQTGMAPSPGRGLLEIFRAEGSGRVIPERDHVLIGQERHDVGRPDDVGYPIRGIVKDDVLYLRNYEPTRWPVCNPETGYLNCDGSPTKTFILQSRRDKGRDPSWDLCFGRRPAEELYDLTTDPDCLHNLAERPDRRDLKGAMQAQMVRELEAQHDPRQSGEGSVFDRYPYAFPLQRGFYNRFIAGEKSTPGWVHPTDFEARPLD